MAVAPDAGGGPDWTKKNPGYANVSGSLTTSSRDPLANPGAYKINVPNKMERINQPLYSYQSYPAAGAASLTFFQTQAGGTTTRQDTNLTLQGQLPSPQMFLIQGIGVDYLPGLTTSAPVSLRADAATGALNDFYAVMKQGVLSLTVGSKEYFTMSPMIALPPRAHMDGVGAVTSATTAAAALQTIIQIPFATGDVWKPIPLLLESSQNFSVTINYPGGAVAIPSTDAAARIGVILYGTLYRPAQ